MAPAAKKEKKARTQPINSELKKTGIMRLSRGRMFHKPGLWLIEKWKKAKDKKEDDEVVFFERPRLAKVPSFLIRHYAADVVYEVAGFIDRYNHRRRHSSAEMLSPVAFPCVAFKRSLTCQAAPIQTSPSLCTCPPWQPGQQQERSGHGITSSVGHVSGLGSRSGRSSSASTRTSSTTPPAGPATSVPPKN